jgi:glutaredoxin 3
VKIEIYTSNSCPFCLRAKALFDKKSASYVEYHIDKHPEFLSESINRSGGRRTVPQIFIEDYHVGGYDDLADLEKKGKLDAMLAGNAEF